MVHKNCSLKICSWNYLPKTNKRVISTKLKKKSDLGSFATHHSKKHTPACVQFDMCAYLERSSLIIGLCAFLPLDEGIWILTASVLLLVADTDFLW